MKNNSLYPSKVKCSDFFETLVSIIPKEVGEPGDIGYFIKNKDYEYLYASLFGQQTFYVKKRFENTYGSDSLFTFDMILCSVQYICGNYEECSKILNSPKNDYTFLFPTSNLMLLNINLKPVH